MKHEEAYKNFQENKYNCCESVLLAFGEEVGIPSELLPKLGTGFGGGYAHKGLTCGVINAATIILNAKYGRKIPGDPAIKENFEKVSKFIKTFKDEFGSIYCKAITKTNFEKEDKFQEWLQSGGRNECAKLVKQSAIILEDLLND